MAIDLPRVQGHGQCLGHVVLNRGGNGGLLVSCTHMDLARAQVFEFAGAGLRDLHVGD